MNKISYHVWVHVVPIFCLLVVMILAMDWVNTWVNAIRKNPFSLPAGIVVAEIF